MKDFDYIIVGQGIAGSSLAIRLLDLGKKVLVIDQPEKNSSSRIAAGMFNPVTGQRMALTWLAEIIFPELNTFYTAVERKANTRFFYPTALYRPFLTIEEQNEWMGRSADQTYARYIQSVFTNPAFDGIKNQFGGLLLKQCGFIDTKAFIRVVLDRLKQEASVYFGEFDFGKLIPFDDHVQYGDITARQIVFCHGIHRNPLFDWLPLKPLKGETVSITSPFREQVIVNRGAYILPADDAGTQRVGSTYYHDDKADGPTTRARKELEDKIDALVDFKYEIIDHQWGWRPTVPDHKPLVGRHPAFQSVLVFNGLGTKGISLAPYFSKVLVDLIENRVPLNKEIDIDRYKSLYWKSPK